jgi:hypothetical protein
MQKASGRFRACVQTIMLLLLSTTAIAKAPGEPSHDDSYDQAIKSGKANIQPIRELVQFWPEAHHLITHYTGQAGPTFWQSAIPLFKRYMLTVQIEITLDETRTRS